MFCPKCGSENADGTKFCGKCGAGFCRSENAPSRQEAVGAGVAAGTPSLGMKKPLVIIGAIVGVALAGCLAWLMIGKDEPLYLPTQMTEYKDGELVREYRYEYEDGFIVKQQLNDLSGGTETTTTYDRDSDGFILTIATVSGSTKYEYACSYELNEKGLPQKMTQSSDDSIRESEYEYSDGFISKKEVMDCYGDQTYLSEDEWEYAFGWPVRRAFGYDDANSSFSEDRSYKYAYDAGSDLPASAFLECIACSSEYDGKEREVDPSERDEQQVYAYDENGCLASVVTTSSVSLPSETEKRTEYSGYIKIEHPTPLMLFEAMDRGWYRTAKRAQQ